MLNRPTGIRRLAPLSIRMIKNFRNRYTEIWKIFLARLWRENGLINKRIDNYSIMLQHELKRDFYQKSLNSIDYKTLPDRHLKFKNYLNRRFKFALEQLD